MRRTGRFRRDARRAVRRGGHGERAALAELLLLALVPLADRAQVADDARVDFRLVPAGRAGVPLAAQVAVLGADAEGRCEREVGQTVVAIGTALGEFRSTVTKGVISGLGRGITAGGFGVGTEKLEDVIQVDAAINPGNSGGPLFDSNAKVIGVNVAVSQSGQSIGFALPINLVKASVTNFRQTGEFDRPYLGVAYQMISERAALLNEVPVGAYVQTVITDSPAAKAGLKAGDIITEIDGKKLSNNETSIADIVNHKKIGDGLKLKYYRNDKETEIKVKLEKRVN